MVKRINTKESKQLLDIESAYYTAPTLKLLWHFIESGRNKKDQWRKSFNHIYIFLQDANPEVEKILIKRKNEGKINDIPQTRKSIVGKMFSSLIEYVFIKNKEIGNIPTHYFITSKSSAIKYFNESITIYADGETQKPDCDLIIYNDKNGKLLILSLKTSLRERAGQTYKWKLLLEIANSTDQQIKQKYKISYRGKHIPLVCFATVNFYNEINNPQQRGMFKFFDKAFIAKPIIHGDFIADMSEIIELIQEKL